jgi:hypothetical protein
MMIGVSTHITHIKDGAKRPAEEPGIINQIDLTAVFMPL